MEEDRNIMQEDLYSMKDDLDMSRRKLARHMAETQNLGRRTERLREDLSRCNQEMDSYGMTPEDMECSRIAWELAQCRSSLSSVTYNIAREQERIEDLKDEDPYNEYEREYISMELEFSESSLREYIRRKESLQKREASLKEALSRYSADLKVNTEAVQKETERDRVAKDLAECESTLAKVQAEMEYEKNRIAELEAAISSACTRQNAEG